jgi:hypothetical protein
MNANYKNIDISCGETKLANWLERLYYRSKPLYSTTRETQAPEPNYFAIITKGGNSYEFPVKQWNSPLTIDGLIADTENLTVLFFKRTTDSDLQLSVVALPVIMMNAKP